MPSLEETRKTYQRQAREEILRSTIPFVAGFYGEDAQNFATAVSYYLEAEIEWEGETLLATGQ